VGLSRRFDLGLGSAPVWILQRLLSVSTFAPHKRGVGN
jgi:hypothetical protein